jgi:hypothetical protein
MYFSEGGNEERAPYVNSFQSGVRVYHQLHFRIASPGCLVWVGILPGILTCERNPSCSCLLGLGLGWTIDISAWVIPLLLGFQFSVDSLWPLPLRETKWGSQYYYSSDSIPTGLNWINSLMSHNDSGNACLAGSVFILWLITSLSWNSRGRAGVNNILWTAGS